MRYLAVSHQASNSKEQIKQIDSASQYNKITSTKMRFTLLVCKLVYLQY